MRKFIAAAATLLALGAGAALAGPAAGPSAAHGLQVVSDAHGL